MKLQERMYIDLEVLIQIRYFILTVILKISYNAVSIVVKQIS